MSEFSENEFPPAMCPYNIISENPHVAQFQNTKINENFNPFKDLDILILKDDAPQKAYQRRKGERKTVSSNKLKSQMLIFIQFLTEFSTTNQDQKTVVFNNGNNFQLILKLCPLFDFMIFQVYDFTFELELPSNLNIFKEKLTNKLSTNSALIIQNEELFKLTVDESNAKYLQIMNNQMELVKVCQPLHFLVPFQLPWTDKNYDFLDGKIYTYPHSQPSQTQVALFGTQFDSVREYSAQKLEQQMFNFNTETRNQLFNHRLTVGKQGKFFKNLDCCLDCTCEIVILVNYCKKVRNYSGIYEVYDLNQIYESIQFQRVNFREKELEPKKGK